MTGSLHVTDHAVLRWLERSWGVDVEGLRARIAAQVPGAEAAMRTFGEGAVIREGLRFHLRRTADGTVALVTITSAQAGPISNRAERLSLRHQRSAHRRPDH
ncbi:hypothetical protein [Ruegeria sp.]|uniref:hypothetical protein n=1 Tax=Ruegeria sp. TaxID=1879320 RepID=UPI003B000CBC